MDNNQFFNSIILEHVWSNICIVYLLNLVPLTNTTYLLWVVRINSYITKKILILYWSARIILLYFFFRSWTQLCWYSSIDIRSVLNENAKKKIVRNSILSGAAVLWYLSIFGTRWSFKRRRNVWHLNAPRRGRLLVLP